MTRPEYDKFMELAKSWRRRAKKLCERKTPDAYAEADGLDRATRELYKVLSTILEKEGV